MLSPVLLPDPVLHTSLLNTQPATCGPELRGVTIRYQMQTNKALFETVDDMKYVYIYMNIYEFFRALPW